MLSLSNRLKLASPVLGGEVILPPIAGPDIWLDANQELFANNDPVGQFTDWSGNGNHFITPMLNLAISNKA